MLTIPLSKCNTEPMFKSFQVEDVGYKIHLARAQICCLGINKGGQLHFLKIQVHSKCTKVALKTSFFLLSRSKTPFISLQTEVLLMRSLIWFPSEFYLLVVTFHFILCYIIGNCVLYHI